MLVVLLRLWQGDVPLDRDSDFGPKRNNSYNSKIKLILPYCIYIYIWQNYKEPRKSW